MSGTQLTQTAIKINEVYKPLYTTTKRYVLITGGRGSLKTTTVQDYIARLTYERGNGILYTRYTMVSARTSIIPEMVATLTRMGIVGDFHITATEIINKHTGSFIIFSGIKQHGKDQTDKLKSIAGITTWVVEEGEGFTNEIAFDAIDDSIRTTTAVNKVIWIQNPTTKEHFVYKRWIENNQKTINIEGWNVTVSNHEDVEHIHTTYHIAERLNYLAVSWLKKAKESLEKALSMPKEEMYKSHYYTNYIGGWLEKRIGVILPNWEWGEFDRRLPTVIGLDWGFSPDPLAAVRIAVDKKKERVYWEQMIYDTEIMDVVYAIKKTNIGKRELIVCDTGRERERRRIKDARYRIETTKGKKGVSDELIEMSKLTHILHPGSEKVAKEFNHYIWNDTKKTIPLDEWNHAIDGGRYGYRRLTTNRRGLRGGNM